MVLILDQEFEDFLAPTVFAGSILGSSVRSWLSGCTRPCCWTSSDTARRRRNPTSDETRKPKQCTFASGPTSSTPFSPR